MGKWVNIDENIYIRIFFFPNKFKFSTSSKKVLVNYCSTLEDHCYSSTGGPPEGGSLAPCNGSRGPEHSRRLVRGQLPRACNGSRGTEHSRRLVRGRLPYACDVSRGTEHSRRPVRGRLIRACDAAEAPNNPVDPSEGGCLAPIDDGSRGTETPGDPSKGGSLTPVMAAEASNTPGDAAQLRVTGQAQRALDSL